MIFGRFLHGNREVFGVVQDGNVLEVVQGQDGTRIAQEAFPVDSGIFLPPVLPTKIVAVGLNYRKHAEEMGKPLPETPLLFLKPATAVIAHGQPIVIPGQSEQVEFEAELGVVIGRECRKVSEEEALGYVLGYTCVNDVTARDLQRSDVQYTRAKGFDTFAPTGPFLATEINPDQLGIRSFVNGEPRQDSNTSDMVFSVAKLIAFVSSVMTLKPGDIISTGTPSGVGPLKPGDVVEVEIDEIGRLRNPVAAES